MTALAIALSAALTAAVALLWFRVRALTQLAHEQTNAIASQHELMLSLAEVLDLHSRALALRKFGAATDTADKPTLH